MMENNYFVERVLTNEKGNLKRLPKEFYYPKISFKEYSLNNFRDRRMIDAIYDSDLSQYTQVVSCTTSKLLMSMLALRNKLSDNIFVNIERTMLDDSTIDDKAAKSIIKWCKINGYPFQPEEDSSLKNRPLFTNVNSKHAGFRIADFIYQLNEISSAFLLYLKLLGEKVSLGKASISLPLTDSGQELKKFKLLRDMSEDEIMSILGNKYKAISFTNQISLEGGVCIQQYAKDLFDAAFYELAMLMMEPEKEYRICQLCHSYFVVEDGRQKYCKNINEQGQRTCTAQKEYKRKHQKQKRTAEPVSPTVPI